MDKILASIATRIKYIRNNTTTPFILDSLKVIEIKLDEFKDKKYTSVAVVENICDHIVSYDISRMKRVMGETNMVYKKMDELAGFVQEIKTAYFI